MSFLSRIKAKINYRDPIFDQEFCPGTGISNREVIQIKNKLAPYKNALLDFSSDTYSAMKKYEEAVILELNALMLHKAAEADFRNSQAKACALSFLFPKKHREEWIGDILELKNSLECEGYSKAWRQVRIISQKISILLHAAYYKLCGFLSFETKRKME